MILRFGKPGDPAKLGGLTVVREDGSTEFQASPAPGFIVHDLAHYAVESVLGLRGSFLGLLARGHPLGQISQTAGQWLPGLPLEARQTEFIVSLLQSEFMGFASGEPQDAAAFNAALSEACRRKRLQPPRMLTQDELERLRARLRELMAEWAATPRGSALELVFPPA